MARDNSALIAKYSKEKRVKVLGNSMFKQFLGSVYTFTFNGFPVSIKFDGSYQEYPETIARVIERKLNEIAKANTPITKDEQI